MPRKRGHPRGSCNKKTLAALAAASTTAAATQPLGIGRSSIIAMAPGGTVVAAAGGAVVPAAATFVVGLTGTPLQVAAALVGAAMAFGAAPPGLAGLDVGGFPTSRCMGLPPPCAPAGREQ
jgi:hypothetical protein